MSGGVKDGWTHKRDTILVEEGREAQQVLAYLSLMADTEKAQRSDILKAMQYSGSSRMAHGKGVSINILNSALLQLQSLDAGQSLGVGGLLAPDDKGDTCFCLPLGETVLLRLAALAPAWKSS